MMQPF